MEKKFADHLVTIIRVLSFVDGYLYEKGTGKSRIMNWVRNRSLYIWHGLLLHTGSFDKIN